MTAIAITAAITIGATVLFIAGYAKGRMDAEAYEQRLHDLREGARL